MKRKAFTLIELLVVIAIIAILAAILFPVFAQAKLAAKKSASASNNRQVALAAIMYSSDTDDMIPVVMKGAFGVLANLQPDQVSDGSGNEKGWIAGEERAEGWPVLLLPYTKSRAIYVDPSRGDVFGIWTTPMVNIGDPGYSFASSNNTNRTQSRYSMYGVNYLFLSPFHIPTDKMTASYPTDYMAGEGRSFTQAEDPAGTVFYTESRRYAFDTARGFFCINAPGMWINLAHDDVQYVIFWGGYDCSGDWCGDTDSTTPGRQKESNSVHLGFNEGANTTFLDGHVAHMKDGRLAAGTNYLTATPNDGGGLTPGYLGGGAVITDKNKYIWNLDDNYYEQ